MVSFSRFSSKFNKIDSNTTLTKCLCIISGTARQSVVCASKVNECCIKLFGHDALQREFRTKTWRNSCSFQTFLCIIIDDTYSYLGETYGLPGVLNSEENDLISKRSIVSPFAATNNWWRHLPWTILLTIFRILYIWVGILFILFLFYTFPKLHTNCLQVMHPAKLLNVT